MLVNNYKEASGPSTRGRSRITDNLNKSTISRIINRSGKINDRLPGFPALATVDPHDFYINIIKPSLEMKSESSEENEIGNLKKFLETENVTLNKEPGLDATYEDWIIEFVKEALPNYEIPCGPSNNSTDGSPSSSKKPERCLKPKMWIPRKVNCIGRGDLLEAMQQKIGASGFVVLSGMGAIGKTTLAVQYALEHRAEYTVQQRIIFDKSITTFKDMILSLGVDNEDPDMSEDAKVEARFDLIERSSASTLLILDNIDKWPDDRDDQRLLERLLENSDIHVVITTRRNDKLTQSKIDVDRLEPHYQMELFEYHLGHPIDSSDKDVVRRILKKINGHTLTTALLARRIADGNLDYNRTLEAIGNGMQEESIYDIPVSGIEYNFHDEKSIAQFIGKIFFRTGDLSEDEVAMMRHLSLLPVSGIPQGLFLELDSHSETTLQQLKSMCLIEHERTESSQCIVKLHQIICDAVRHELDPSIESCAGFLNNLTQRLLGLEETHEDDVDEENEDLDDKDALSILTVNVIQGLDLGSYVASRLEHLSATTEWRNYQVTIQNLQPKLPNDFNYQRFIEKFGLAYSKLTKLLPKQLDYTSLGKKLGDLTMFESIEDSGDMNNSAATKDFKKEVKRKVADYLFGGSANEEHFLYKLMPGLPPIHPITKFMPLLKPEYAKALELLITESAPIMFPLIEESPSVSMVNSLVKQYKAIEDQIMLGWSKTISEPEAIILTQSLLPVAALGLHTIDPIHRAAITEPNVSKALKEQCKQIASCFNGFIDDSILRIRRHDSRRVQDFYKKLRAGDLGLGLVRILLDTLSERFPNTHIDSTNVDANLSCYPYYLTLRSLFHGAHDLDELVLGDEIQSIINELPSLVRNFLVVLPSIHKLLTPYMEKMAISVQPNEYDTLLLLEQVGRVCH